jgi:hypothetical protein
LRAINRLAERGRGDERCAGGKKQDTTHDETPNEK